MCALWSSELHRMHGKKSNLSQQPERALPGSKAQIYIKPIQNNNATKLNTYIQVIPGRYPSISSISQQILKKLNKNG